MICYEIVAHCERRVDRFDDLQPHNDLL